MRYVFTMTGAVVDSDKPLEAPLFKALDEEPKPKAAAKKTAPKCAAKAAQKAQEG